MTRAAERFGDLVTLGDDTLAIPPEGRALTRMVARLFDGYTPDGARYSQAS
ncbi:hypothetical protein KU6B_32870 [Mameliella alba]|nr:hypothetical protein KU6B_32870 [Mameliella alba]